LRAVLHRLLGINESLRQALRKDMDYILTGLASLLLFAYLFYALLKPERF
jgi:K+-transporting ATPase KdpF subunit